jgi:LPXTG-motif cell wall-anchored protein
MRVNKSSWTGRSRLKLAVKSSVPRPASGAVCRVGSPASRATISGNEQILESRITGPLPDSEPKDNVDRTVYSNRVDPTEPSTKPTETNRPSTKPTEVKPTGKPATVRPAVSKPTKRPELAETGADDDNNTLVIGGAAVALVAVGAGGVLLARKRRGTRQA